MTRHIEEPHCGNSSPKSKQHILPTFEAKCVSGVVRIDN